MVCPQIFTDCSQGVCIYALAIYISLYIGMRHLWAQRLQIHKPGRYSLSLYSIKFGGMSSAPIIMTSFQFTLVTKWCVALSLITRTSFHDQQSLIVIGISSWDKFREGLHVYVHGTKNLIKEAKLREVCVSAFINKTRQILLIQTMKIDYVQSTPIQPTLMHACVTRSGRESKRWGSEKGLMWSCANIFAGIPTQIQDSGIAGAGKSRMAKIQMKATLMWICVPLSNACIQDINNNQLEKYSPMLAFPEYLQVRQREWLAPLSQNIPKLSDAHSKPQVQTVVILELNREPDGSLGQTTW